MKMFRKGLFIMAHQCGDTSFSPAYKKLVRNKWKSYGELKRNQENQLRRLIMLSNEYVPYYHDLFKNLGFMPGDIRIIEDLEKLPVLTKEIIKMHREEFKPTNLSSIKYYSQATGGSTGKPMRYRLSKHDRFLGGAILYHGWVHGGHELGDKMIFLTGSSLDIGTKSNFIIKIHEATRNLSKLSSFDIGESEMRRYADILSILRPGFINLFLCAMVGREPHLNHGGGYAGIQSAYCLACGEGRSVHIRRKCGIGTRGSGLRDHSRRPLFVPRNPGEKMRALMASPVIVDGMNLFCREDRIVYLGIGKGLSNVGN